MNTPRTPFKIKKIRNSDDHDRALARIESLMDAETGSYCFDELEVLTTLVEAYKDINKTAASEVLSGKRPLTLPKVRGLHEKFGIPIEALVKSQINVMSKGALALTHFVEVARILKNTRQTIGRKKR